MSDRFDLDYVQALRARIADLERERDEWRGTAEHAMNADANAALLSVAHDRIEELERDKARLDAVISACSCRGDGGLSRNSDGTWVFATRSTRYSGHKDPRAAIDAAIQEGRDA